MARQAAYRKQNQNRTAMLLITLVVVMIGCAVFIRSFELKDKQAEYQAKQEELARLIEEETERHEELLEYEKYTQTKKFVEDVAKAKLNLVYDGEIVFREE